MAFTFNTFSPDGGQAISGEGIRNSIQMHSYKTIDDSDAIQAVGYFDEVAGILNTGDLLQITLDIDGTPLLQYEAVNSHGTPGVVTVMIAVAGMDYVVGELVEVTTDPLGSVPVIVEVLTVSGTTPTSLLLRQTGEFPIGSSIAGVSALPTTSGLAGTGLTIDVTFDAVQAPVTMMGPNVVAA